MKPGNKQAAFTLIEVLVVVAIIALLISILLPSLNAAREQAKRAVCANNIRQMNMACMQYAQDYRDGFYMYNRDPAAYGNGTDSLLHIFPKYLKSHKAALCPSTKNIIRDGPGDRAKPGGRYGGTGLSNFEADLDENAADAFDSDGGHSYEVWGFYDGVRRYPDGKLIDGSKTIIAAGVTPIPHVIKSHKTVARPFDTILLIDADDAGKTNAPDQYGNHGKDGINIGFLDGHTTFVKPRQLAGTYLRSWQNPPYGWNLPAEPTFDPHVEQATDSAGNLWYRVKNR